MYSLVLRLSHMCVCVWRYTSPLEQQQQDEREKGKVKLQPIGKEGGRFISFLKQHHRQFVFIHGYKVAFI